MKQYSSNQEENSKKNNEFESDYKTEPEDMDISEPYQVDAHLWDEIMQKPEFKIELNTDMNDDMSLSANLSLEDLKVMQPFDE
ncbi:25911_t:CDS:2, partial [Gigaspora rosea]